MAAKSRKIRRKIHAVETKAAPSHARELEAAISTITKATATAHHAPGRRAGAKSKSKSSPPARWRWTSRWASAACRAGASIEIFGPESSGKTTLMLHVIANAQKAGGLAAFIDAEHALDPGLRQKTGREPGRPARLAAGQRRRSADHLRNARALQRAGRHRD